MSLQADFAKTAWQSIFLDTSVSCEILSMIDYFVIASFCDFCKPKSLQNKKDCKIKMQAQILQTKCLQIKNLQTKNLQKNYKQKSLSTQKISPHIL